MWSYERRIKLNSLWNGYEPSLKLAADHRYIYAYENLVELDE